MPSSEIMEKYREGKLHSGRGGKIVKSKKTGEGYTFELPKKRR